MNPTMFHYISNFLLKKPEYIDNLVMTRKTEWAATLVNGKFNKLAPMKERIILKDLFFRKWDMFGAAQFLIQCKPESVASVFKEWYESPKFKAHAFKPQVLITMWLSVPAFADKIDKAVDIVDLVTWTMRDRLVEMLQNMPFEASIAYLDKAKAPPVNFILANLPLETAIPLFAGLRKRNPDQFNFRFGKLPPRLVPKVNEKLHHLDEHHIKVEDLQKIGTLLGRLIEITSPPPPEEPPEPAEPPPAEEPRISHPHEPDEEDDEEGEEGEGDDGSEEGDEDGEGDDED